MMGAMVILALAVCALVILSARVRQRARKAAAEGSSLKAVHVQSEAELH